MVFQPSALLECAQRNDPKPYFRYDEKSIASVKRVSPDTNDDAEIEFLREVNKNAEIMATVHIPNPKP